MEYAKLNALSLALFQVGDIRDAEDLLREFMEKANWLGLSVFDRNGERIIALGDWQTINVNRDIVDMYLSSGITNSVDRILTECNNIARVITEDEEEFSAPSAQYFTWNLGSNEYLMMIKEIVEEEEIEIIDYYSWVPRMENYKIGATGAVVVPGAVNEDILFPEDELTDDGKKAVDLGIRLPGSDHSLSMEELQEALSEPGKIITLLIDDERCYAIRLNSDSYFAFCMLPEEEIEADAVGASSAMMILVAVMTGICVLYAILHLRDPKGAETEKTRGFHWNGALCGRLKVAGVIAVTTTLILGLLLEALSAYADTFRYTWTKVTDVVQMTERQTEATSVVEKWFGKELMVKCRVADCLLNWLSPDNMTRDDLTELADRLGVNELTLYDVDGNCVMSSSPFLHAKLDENNPFYSLLTDTQVLMGEIEKDPITGSFEQKAAIAQMDEHDMVKGLLMVEMDASEIEHVMSNMNFENIVRQVSMTDETVTMEIGDDMIIRHLFVVKDWIHDSEFFDYDYAGHPISQMGIRESDLQDHYNGNMFVMNNVYFASVRRVKDEFLLVMRPMVKVDAERLVPVLLITGSVAVLMLLLIAICGYNSKKAAAAMAELPDPDAGSIVLIGPGAYSLPASPSGR